MYRYPYSPLRCGGPRGGARCWGVGARVTREDRSVVPLVGHVAEVGSGAADGAELAELSSANTH